MGKKFAGDGKTGAFADDGVNPAIWAEGRSLAVAIVIAGQPEEDFCRIEDLLAIETSANRILRELRHVVIAKLMGLNVVCHRVPFFTQRMKRIVL